nr:pentatricopeptide repeat-containing protein [Fagopyrum tataricum]
MGINRILLLKHICSKFNSQPPKAYAATTRFTSLLVNRSYANVAYQLRPGKNPDSPLYTRICLLGSSDSSVVPLLDQWVTEGNWVNELLLRRIIRILRHRNRHSQALEVSEWMSTKKLCPFLSSDHAIKLDLIGKVHGASAAEKYFEEIQEKSERIYGSLLNCYVRERLVDKSLSHFEAMKKTGIAKCCLSYNSIMNLYLHTGEHEKIPEVIVEMKRKGVLPDEVSYGLCMNAYSKNHDLEKMEMLLKEMECQPQIIMDSSTYLKAANYYIKAGLSEKAREYLKKGEHKAGEDPRNYGHLITMYTSLGESSEVLRLWTMLKNSQARLINVDYANILASLVKLGEFEEAENIFTDWKSGNTLYDFRVPNTLLLGYTRRGEIDKAEKMLEEIVESGKIPTPNSWSILASGYMRKKDVKGVFKCIKKALAVAPQHRGWEPKPDVVSRILKWLGDEGDVLEVEEFVQSMKRVVAVDREMYHALIKAHIRHGKEVDGVLQSMVADNIDENEETKIILSSRLGLQTEKKG